MNDRRAVLVGVCKASPLFQTTPVVYTRYSQAMAFAPPERQLLSALLVEAEPGVPLRDVCDRIQARTGLQALTREEFGWKTIRYYLRSTGIPINFGITILLGFSVGAAIAGQTFYLFTVENLKQFGTLKAMGLSDLRIVGMILLQAVVVGLIGYGIGMGVAAAFFESTGNLTHLQGFFLPWPVMLITGIAVVVIVILASILSIRKVLILEPAIVFRG
jgi:putative ABC transport system permease protein